MRRRLLFCAKIGNGKMATHQFLNNIYFGPLLFLAIRCQHLRVCAFQGTYSAPHDRNDWTSHVLVSVYCNLLLPAYCCKEDIFDASLGVPNTNDATFCSLPVPSRERFQQYSSTQLEPWSQFSRRRLTLFREYCNKFEI